MDEPFQRQWKGRNVPPIAIHGPEGQRVRDLEFESRPHLDPFKAIASNGFPCHGVGAFILRNAIYVGKIVWNKVRMVKDPSTGKRVSRPNPENKWEITDVPELRVVSDQLFGAAQNQLADRSHRNRSDNVGKQRRPRYLLSGLLRCGACGSDMIRMGKDKSGRTRVRCSAHTNSGTCPNPETFYVNEVEELVIDSLTKELATPDLITAYAQRYIESRFKEEADYHRRRAGIEKRLAKIEAENTRLVKLMLEDGADKKTLGAITKENRRERDRLELELASLPDNNNVILHPTAIKHLAEKLTVPSKNRLQLPRAKLEMTLHMLDDTDSLLQSSANRSAPSRFTATRILVDWPYGWRRASSRSFSRMANP